MTPRMKKMAKIMSLEVRIFPNNQKLASSLLLNNIMASKANRMEIAMVFGFIRYGLDKSMKFIQLKQSPLLYFTSFSDFIRYTIRIFCNLRA